MDSITLKKEIRKRLKAARKALSKAEIQEKSAAIFRLWEVHFGNRNPAYLHLFMSIEKFNEVDTRPWRELALTSSHTQAVVPVTDFAQNLLTHLVLDKEVEFVVNEWGIPEPKLGKKYAAPAQLDMVLVPMLGFDDQLHRIGYGKGFYDGFLAQTRPDCLKIGLCFELGHLSEVIPAQEHDVQLDFVITEKQVYTKPEA